MKDVDRLVGARRRHTYVDMARWQFPSNLLSVPGSWTVYFQGGSYIL